MADKSPVKGGRTPAKVGSRADPDSRLKLAFKSTRYVPCGLPLRVQSSVNLGPHA
jgi:hypothetical protein